MSIFYDKPLTPTSGKQEKSWFTNLKQAVGAASIAVPVVKATELPSLVAKGITLAKGAVGAIATGAKTTIQANPIKSTAIGIAGAGYVASNPYGAVKDVATGTNKLVGGLYNVGGNIRELQDNPTLANASKVFTENPLIVTAGAVSAGALGYYGLKAAQGFSSIETGTKDTSEFISKVKDTMPTLPTNIDTLPVSPLSPQGGNNSSMLPTGGAYPAPNTDVGYTNVDKLPSKSRTYKRKTQNLNIRPINIRNNIMIANKNG